MKKITLTIHCVCEEHTAETIANELKNVFVEWGISNQITVIVTDNALHMIAGVHLNNKQHISCTVHILNPIHY